MMLAGQADASTGFVNFQLIQAQMQGHDATFLSFATEKQPLYGHAIFANAKFAAEQPDVVRRYLKATIEGLLWARGYDLFLNLTTAKALGLTIPESVRARAEEVFQ